MSENLMKLYVSPDYIGEPDLDGKEHILQIVGTDIARGLKGGPASKPQDRGILSLATPAGQPVKKKLILNKTNAKAIAKRYGSKAQDWVGNWIRLVPEKCDAFGQKDTPCIRVYPCAAPVVKKATQSATEPASAGEVKPTA